MKHISLFSGIGGFDLASEWMGWQNVASCEINPFGNKVLEYYWPNAYHHDDIKTLTYEKLNQELTTRFGADWDSNDIVLTGGFPCQPYSAAGKRLGTEDERNLWPEMLRIIREVKPTWVVGENVLGIIDWSDGLVFHEVQADLAAEGYEVQPFVLPACGVNAPHKRHRVFIVANKWLRESECKFGFYSCSNAQYGFCDSCDEGSNYEIWDIADTYGSSLQCRNGQTEEGWKNKRGRIEPFGFNLEWEKFPCEPEVCIGDDGLSERLDGITFPKWRNESIKAAGNAIVPQVVYQIFKAIEQYEQNRNHGEDRKAAD